jgi:hypothetical protein
MRVPKIRNEAFICARYNPPRPLTARTTLLLPVSGFQDPFKDTRTSFEAKLMAYHSPRLFSITAWLVAAIPKETLG